MGQPLVFIVGTFLFVAGLAFYAKAKRRHPAWCLMGFLSLLGLIILACLPDLDGVKGFARTQRTGFGRLGIAALLLVVVVVTFVLSSSVFPPPNGQQASGPANQEPTRPGFSPSPNGWQAPGATREQVADAGEPLGMPEPHQEAAPDNQQIAADARPTAEERRARMRTRGVPRLPGNRALQRSPNADSPAEVSPHPHTPPAFRTWTNSTGAFHVEARLDSYGGGKVALKKENGETKVVPIEMLSEADRDYVNATMPNDGPPTDTELAGGDGGVPFRSLGQGPLLGLRWSPGEWDNEKCLGQVEALFDRQAGGECVIAREGYAVGALNVNATHFVDAVQIVFMRMGSDGRLDPTDRYTSDWLGFPTNKLPTILGGTGAIVLGVQGRGAAVVDALGLILRGR
ncbi:MAG: SHD1 domain-containing protein [Thermoguttaceae bacterium]